MTNADDQKITWPIYYDAAPIVFTRWSRAPLPTLPTLLRIGWECYNDVDDHDDDDHPDPMIVIVDVDDDDGVNPIGGYNDVDNHGDDNHSENAENV